MLMVRVRTRCPERAAPAGSRAMRTGWLLAALALAGSADLRFPSLEAAYLSAKLGSKKGVCSFARNELKDPSVTQLSRAGLLLHTGPLECSGVVVHCITWSALSYPRPLDVDVSRERRAAPPDRHSGPPPRLS